MQHFSGLAGLRTMRLLQLMLAALLAAFALLVAIGVVFGRFLRRWSGNSRPVGPTERKTAASGRPDEIIDVETTVVSADQGDR